MNTMNHLMDSTLDITSELKEKVTMESLLSEIASRREEFNQRSHVPRDMIDKMIAVGIFRASTPKMFGGDALPPMDFLRIVERIAEVDGSTAWVTAFGSANIYLAALPVETQKIIYASGPDQVYAGGLYPIQPATRVEHGWEVTGHWKFASGCKGASWLGVGIGGTAANGSGKSAGKPLTAVFPAREVEIVENWNVIGMQGTGSHDLRLNQKIVDDQWTFVRGTDATIDEPLYHYPSISYQAQVHAAVNLGLARAALDIVASMSGSEKTLTGAPRLGDRSYYRMTLGKAEAMYRSARAFYYEAPEAAWADILAGKPVTDEKANLLRLSATYAAQVCSEVVKMAYHLAGTAAIFTSNRLQWILRDSLVVTQHAFLGEAIYDGAGAIFSGIDPVTPYP
jgi:indole-3-acetate monooxygenase